MIACAGSFVWIEVAYARSDEQILLTLSLPYGSTAQDAIERSRLLEKYPELSLKSLEVGVFGRRITLDHVLSEGDRVEVYRPLLADPKQLRRRRAKM